MIYLAMQCMILSTQYDSSYSLALHCHLAATIHTYSNWLQTTSTLTACHFNHQTFTTAVSLKMNFLFLLAFTVDMSHLLNKCRMYETMFGNENTGAKELV